MPRYRLTVEYDGTPFVGWQRQENGLSVQQVIEEAVEGFCAESVTAFAAGRTDAGVHALGQVVHIDLGGEHDERTVRDALNAHMRDRPVSVLSAAIVDEDFHARFSATARAYLYRIVNRAAPLTIDANRAWRVPRPLDAEAMHRAAQALVGKHDFTTFRAAQCQAKTPVKTLTSISVERREEVLRVRLAAPSFLHNQVRAIVGSLKLVGEGKWAEDRVAEVLAARERSACGPTAPAEGLYLESVSYPD